MEEPHLPGGLSPCSVHILTPEGQRVSAAREYQTPYDTFCFLLQRLIGAGRAPGPLSTGSEKPGLLGVVTDLLDDEQLAAAAAGAGEDGGVARRVPVGVPEEPAGRVVQAARPVRSRVVRRACRGVHASTMARAGRLVCTRGDTAADRPALTARRRR